LKEYLQSDFPLTPLMNLPSWIRMLESVAPDIILSVSKVGNDRKLLQKLLQKLPKAGKVGN